MSSSLRQFVERVIASGLLEPALIQLAEYGATASELATAPPLPAGLRELLMWRNGLDLEVVRLHGVGNASRRLEGRRVGGNDVVVFASDPAGFLYLLRADGSVASLDHDGAKIEPVAVDVDDFLRGYIFGGRAAEFGGPAWAHEVATTIGEG